MTYLLNLTDLLFTLHAIRHGGVELNPLLQSIPIMILYKVILVGILCWWLGKRKEKIAHIGLIVCTVWFGAVNLWHIYNLLLIGGI